MRVAVVTARAKDAALNIPITCSIELLLIRTHAQTRKTTTNGTILEPTCMYKKETSN